VVAPDSVPFERTLGTEIGAMLRTLHEGHGVEFRLGRTVSEIDENVVRLDDGSRLEADLVVVGIGVRPDTRLAEAAGLEVEDGVLVNEYLESSVPNVFAAGDIARWPNPRTGERVRVEHWVVAQRLGQSAARNILGQRKPFADVPFFWTQHYDLPVAYVGHAARWDDARVEGDPQAHDCLVSYLRDGKTLAVTAVHRDRAALKAEAAMEAAS
jgi:3-phenylpropionate/trans-cinnamate dioxygenase ferredoxin reductase subunit